MLVADTEKSLIERMALVKKTLAARRREYDGPTTKLILKPNKQLPVLQVLARRTA